MHLLIDATGIKAEGEGEWNARKHGGSKKRLWRTAYDVSENLAEGFGIAQKAAISLTMALVNKGGPEPRVEVVLIPGGAILPNRELPEFCTQ